MILALVCGAGLGAGLWLVVRGLYPPRPSLAQALADLRRLPEPSPATDVTEGGFAARAGRPLAAGLLRAGGAWLVLSPVRRDLAVLGAAGFVVPDLGIRSDAARRRRDFRHALSSFLDLVVVALAGGGGVETALADAAGVGSGWAFDHLRRALDQARLARQAPWETLGRLGVDLGIAELSELAASVALAGTEGAKVRASLTAKAVSLRTHALAEAETADQAASERMSLPVVCLFAGFLFFLGYPAVEKVLTSLH